MILATARADDRAVSLLLFAALWLLILASMALGQYRRMERETRADLVGVEASE